MNYKKTKVGIIGLGYVGLPLLLLIKKKFETYGFDLSEEKIKLLKIISHIFQIYQTVN